MKKIIIIGIIAVVIIVVGGVLAKTKLFTKKDNPTASGGESSEMQTVKVEVGSISEVISASGTIEPLRIVEVSSKASGKIISMPVDKGDYLNEGDLIAEIEKTYAQNDYDQAQADLRSAKAKLEQAKINIELERKQRETQLSQAEENLKEARTRLTQLEEQLELDRKANARKLLEAQNNLDIAKLQLRMLSPEVVREEELKRAEASVAQAKANLELAQKEFDRQKNLYDKNYISKAELDSTQQKLESAQAQYDSAQEQLKIVKKPATREDMELAQANVKKAEFALQAAQEDINAEKTSEKGIELQRIKVMLMESALVLAKSNLDQVEIRRKDLITAQASVSRSESQLQTAKEKLNDTLVTAPISGTILEKNVEEGQVITSRISSVAGQGTPLVTMADLTKIYVKTDVDETDIGKVQPGQSVTIKVDAFPNRTFAGKVLKIAPQGKVTQNVTTFEVTTELIDEPDVIEVLKPGMNAEVEIMAASAQNVLLVPNEAIMNFGGRQMVRVVGEERPRRVETGASNWEKTEIISGLSEGEEVVIAGASGLGGSGMDPFARFRERLRRDPSAGLRMMRGERRR
ncbi:TPA: efflux RND transporter periplasmic adaptor subunit [Candidatus Poribacteria bacterium]|nr:efflux RND transporter periplasmic adaptor subunit [Candidatus Poribacteria bacterium]